MNLNQRGIVNQAVRRKAWSIAFGKVLHKSSTNPEIVYYVLRIAETVLMEVNPLWRYACKSSAF
ncbi:MAG: hypothetical protein BWY09_01924 [Candidatus Hydrogenedentes bacterium ADurb.Bin179]|nr:MAG: hypothetical protein BWY09_01924 [Candidatus Hydrogenedentes bacterium ADurb.Bin179]